MVVSLGRNAAVLGRESCALYLPVVLETTEAAAAATLGCPCYHRITQHHCTGFDSHSAHFISPADVVCGVIVYWALLRELCEGRGTNNESMLGL